MTTMQQKDQGRRITTILIAALMVLAIGALIVMQPAAAATNCPKSYTIATGDTLYKIAQTYKVAWEDIVKLNDLKAPYTMIVGTSICIPVATSATTTPKSGTPSASSKATTAGGPAIVFDGYSNYLGVSITGFPTNKVFYVKGGQGWVSPNGHLAEWYPLGRVKTDKNGVGKTAYRLPIRLDIQRPILICMKDTTSDDAYCKYYVKDVNVKQIANPSSSAQ
jgi:hypothetical protein